MSYLLYFQMITQKVCLPERLFQLGSIKDALSGLRQFLATESPLKVLNGAISTTWLVGLLVIQGW